MLKKRILILIYLSLSPLLFGAATNWQNPWGKDGDLVTKIVSKKADKCCETPFFGNIGESVIRFHQTVITPCDGPRSHFRPSSSQYMLDAMRKYGFFKGFSMGCDRLMRENSDPWVYRVTLNEQGALMKYDPVP